jgi:hypothetical protein
MKCESREPGRLRRRAIQCFGLAGVATMIACLATQSAGSRRVPIAREAKLPSRLSSPNPNLTCPGGADYPADVQLVPDAVITTGGRESVEYHAEINVHRGGAVGLAWQADVIDDRGNAVAPNLATGTANAKAAQSVTTAGILAQNLPDGYYKLRVRVAVSADHEPATVMEAVQPIRLSKGQWQEMDADQWRNQSNARLAYAVTGPIRKGAR